MTERTRGDLCPGVFRPWPADDGALVRLRLPGGHLSRTTLLSLVAVAEQYGDGRVHLTTRANLQLRALPARRTAYFPPRSSTRSATPGCCRTPTTSWSATSSSRR